MDSKEIAVLRRLADTDPSAFARAIGSHLRFRYAVFAVLSTLRDRPGLVDLVRNEIADDRQFDLDRWLNREPIALPDGRVASFCAAVTRSARRLMPGFPALDEERFEVVGQCSWACMYRADTREHGVGWTVEGESRDIGPAETVHEEEWSATAHGPDEVLEYGMFASSGMPVLCWRTLTPSEQ